MSALAAIHARRRFIVSTFLLMVLAGLYAYLTIPREADPDIQVPVFIVNVALPGVAPEDAEQLLVRPLEDKLKGLPRLKELTAVARENGATLIVEFEVEADADAAGRKLREKVDEAKADLPEEAEEPVIEEINLALKPAIMVTVSGPATERALYRHARKLADAIEALPEVLEARLSGHREEVVEVIFDQRKLEAYRITLPELVRAVQRFNRLVPAGAIEMRHGRLAVKAPGLFRSVRDVMQLPVKAHEGAVVRLADVAEIRRTFKRRETYARVNGEPAMTIEVVKRVGANILATVEKAKAVTRAITEDWPSTIHARFAFDESRRIGSVLESLQNAVLTAVFLVMVLVTAFMGGRPALLVGLSIPAAFLITIALMALFGYTMNVMMLFGLVLTVGMLVDAAIVVVEFADRRMAEGLAPAQAFTEAAQRMFWPILTSTATTVAAFLPLMLWPGIVGKFMANLPVTVVIVLSASLFVAMVVIPVLGGWFMRRAAGGDALAKMGALARSGAESDEMVRLPGFTGAYGRFLARLIRHAGITTLAGLLLIGGIFIVYGKFNKGVEFFAHFEPERAFVFVRARGNLSAEEKLRLARRVEREILSVRDVRTVHTIAGRVGQLALNAGAGADQPRDAVGRMLVEFPPYRARTRSSWETLAEVRRRVSAVPGVIVEVREFQQGPPTGKDIRLQVRSTDFATANRVAGVVSMQLKRMEGFIDVEDERPLPGFERRVVVERAEAGRFGADVITLGALVQLLTDGAKIGAYRPDDADDELDIRVRFPEELRYPGRIPELRLLTPAGLVPVSEFVRIETAPLVSSIVRKDGLYSVYVKANVAEGLDRNVKQRELAQWLVAQRWPANVQFVFRGADEEQEKASAFLGKAIVAAVLLMLLILLAQFESFWHAALVLSTLVMSVAGALIGMLVMGQKFSIIMTGTGLVALAGIVVNNAIVLIDTYQLNRRRGFGAEQAALISAMQRLRPVLLTTITTIIGLLPLVFELNVDWFGARIEMGSEISGWWVQLSTAIVFGLAFATLLTLVLIPVLLALPARIAGRWRSWRGRVRGKRAATATAQS